MRKNSKTTPSRLAPGRIAAGTGLAFGLVATVALATGVPISAPSAASATAAIVAMPGALLSGEKTLDTLTMSTEDAQATLDGARATLDDAAALTAEISTSGFDLGDSTIDTVGLRESIFSLAEADTVPVLLYPDLAEDATTQAQAVDARAAELRATLEAARAEKAAADAAAEAQRQAEAAAAAQAQAEAEALAAANTVDGAKATAARMAAEQYGWGSDQFSCLSSLWQKESSWNYQARNSSSGAAGIPQALPGSKMATIAGDWQTNAATQIAWGLKYIDAAYGSPCAAWGKSQAVNWY